MRSTAGNGDEAALATPAPDRLFFRLGRLCTLRSFSSSVSQHFSWYACHRSSQGVPKQL